MLLKIYYTYEGGIAMTNDVIYAEDVLAMFDGKLTYRVLLNMIREKKLPAMKAGRRYIFSRQVVERWRNKQLGL